MGIINARNVLRKPSSAFPVKELRLTLTKKLPMEEKERIEDRM
jgi:hypothetical protein